MFIWTDLGLTLGIYFKKNIYEEAEAGNMDAFNFDVDDPDASHYPVPIIWNRVFQEFEPVEDKCGLDDRLVNLAYGLFLEKADQILSAIEQERWLIADFPKKIRKVILSALPEHTAMSGEKPKTAHIYIPERHAKALRPDNMLVEGIRGAGKSFWWSAL